MNKFFYSRLAVINIRKNGKTYVPYLLTCIGTVMMYFMVHSLSCNSGLAKLRGSNTVISTLELGGYVTAIFALIFLFYTNSFLIKGRKKEFGLYNILGMEKRHLIRILFYETFFTAVISLVVGLLAGIVLNKLVFLGLLALLKSEIPLGFEISIKALCSTLGLFGIIFVLIFLNSFRQIRLAKPIELLQGGQVGEREPKTKWLLAFLGVLCLGGGYYIAMTVKNPISAITLFFMAVILVIVGTYLLFTAGSIAFLKFLRKQKRYYYKTRHFISVSGMMYRMKQNATGLANICILSTMVLVMISSTLSMYLGMEDMLQSRYPRSIMITAFNDKEEVIMQEIREKASAVLEEKGLIPSEVVDCSYLNFSVLQQGDFFNTDQSMFEEGAMNSLTILEDLKNLFFITWEDYCNMNREIAEEFEQPEKGEVLFYTNREEVYSYETLHVFDREFRIAGHLPSFDGTGLEQSDVIGTYYLVVRDKQALDEIFQFQKEAYKENASDLVYCYGFELKGEKEQQIEAYKDLKTWLKGKEGIAARVECRENEREWSMITFGGFFFIGIFLGLLFIMATILIIYYKQISEGYDDKKRFEIMQKVGMSRHEVKSTIHSQVLTVFFLPLVTAGIHIVFAFPIIRQILMMFNLTNVRLFAICTVGCFLVFALFYAILYGATTKVYYRIVNWEQ